MILVNQPAPEGEEFVLVSGEQVSTIEELLEFLRQISDDEFKQHVTNDRNDFANWIRDVHEKKELAEKVENCESRKEMIDVLHRVVKEHYKEDFKSSNESEGKKAKVDHPIETEHGEFLRKEFIYGLIFGFILGLLTAGVLNALG